MRPLSLIMIASLPVACGGSTPHPAVESAPPAALAPLYVPNRPAEYGGGDAGSVPISNADVVIEASRESFRRCYQTGLNVDPTMEGKLLISANQAALDKLVAGGVKADFLRKHYLRAKAIVSDDRAYIGSQNFTNGGLRNNRELGEIFDDHDLVTKLVSTFESDSR